MFQSLGKLVEGVKDFLDPQARPGAVYDSVLGKSFPTRDGLGIVLDSIPSVVSALSPTIGMSGTFMNMSGPQITRMKIFEDGERYMRILDQEGLQAVLADIEFQMQMGDQVTYVPKPASILKEP